MKWLGELLRQNRVTAAVATVVLLMLAFVLWNYFSPGTDPRIEAIRKAGYPATLAELDAWYPAVPDAENAALVYTQAFRRLNTDFRRAERNSTNGPYRTLIGDIALPRRGGALAVEDMDKIVRILATNHTALQILNAAQKLSRSRYPIDMTQGPLTPLPHLSQIRNAVQLLTAKATLDAFSGEMDQAVTAFDAAGRVSDSIAEEPFLISQMSRHDCWSTIITRLEVVISAEALSEKHLAALQLILQDAERPRSYARGLAGDRVIQLTYYSDRKFQIWWLISPGTVPQLQNAKRTDVVKASVKLTLLKLSGYFNKDRTFYLDSMATNIAATELTYPQRYSVGMEAAAMATNLPSRFCFISRLILGVFYSLPARAADQVARIRVAQAALAVERYRRAHGEDLPTSLCELVPKYLSAVTQDPIDGQPLRFKKLSKGYVIYSIGSDGKDDGGAESRTSYATPGIPRDITFIVER